MWELNFVCDFNYITKSEPSLVCNLYRQHRESQLNEHDIEDRHKSALEVKQHQKKKGKKFARPTWKLKMPLYLSKIFLRLSRTFNFESEAIGKNIEKNLLLILLSFSHVNYRIADVKHCT